MEEASPDLATLAEGSGHVDVGGPVQPNGLVVLSFGSSGRRARIAISRLAIRPLRNVVKI